MAIQWTGLGPDLLLRLDRDSGESLGAQLQDQLRDAIRTGRLATGERLPSTRQLAAELGVSRGLVVDCYAQLEAEGYLTSRGGSATLVAATTEAVHEPTQPAVTAPRLDVNFRYGEPDLSSFPMRDWLWALREAARQAPIASGAYGSYQGVAALREVVAAYLGRVRGVATSAASVVVCAGFAQGLGLATRGLAGRGITVVAAEDPRDLDNDTIVERGGAEVVSIPVDDRGLDVDALAATKARAVVLTPAHQAPTGVVLAPERRQALINWASDVDGYIIEDDYDAEFRYDRQPIGSLQGLCPNRVMSIGSVSKSLAPAMRLGWVVCPPTLVDDIVHEKHIADRGSPALDQWALARLIESGRYDRHLRRMRAVYAARRTALVEALAEHAPGIKLGGLAAGFHAVIDLPDSADEVAVVDTACERGVGLYGMSPWRSSGAMEPPQLVLGFGNVTESAIRHGIATVGDLLRDRR